MKTRDREAVALSRLKIIFTVAFVIIVSSFAFTAGRASAISEVERNFSRLSSSRDFPSHQCEKILQDPSRHLESPK